MPTGICSLYENSNAFLGFLNFSIFPSLLIYSYIPGLVFFMFIFIVFYKYKDWRLNFVLGAFFFSVFADLLIWLSFYNSIIYYLWFFIIPDNVLMILSMFFLLNSKKEVFSFNDFTNFEKILLILSSFIFLLSFTTLNTTNQYDYLNCSASFGPLWHVLFVFRILFTIYVAFSLWKKSDTSYRIGSPILFTVGLETVVDYFSSLSGEYKYDGLRVVGYILVIMVYLYNTYFKANDKQDLIYKISLIVSSAIALVSFGSLFLVGKDSFHWLLYSSLVLNIGMSAYLIKKQIVHNSLLKQVERYKSEQKEILQNVASTLGFPEPKVVTHTAIQKYLSLFSRSNEKKVITTEKISLNEFIVFIKSYLNIQEDNIESKILDQSVLFVDKNKVRELSKSLFSDKKVVCNIEINSNNNGELKLISSFGKTSNDRDHLDNQKIEMIKNELRVLNIEIVVDKLVEQITVSIPFECNN